MKPAGACLLVALALVDAPAMAQGAGDPVGKLQACSSLTGAERARCLDKLSRENAPESARPPTAAGSESTTTLDSWVYSETASPIDYSPVVIAFATADGAPDGSGMKLSIACRGGNTSLALTAPGVLPTGEPYIVSYAVDAGPPTTLAATAAPFGTGLVLAVDVIRLLVSLPAQGKVAFRIAGRRGGTLEGRYSLAGLKTIRERMAVACKWPVNPDTTQK